SLQMPQTLWLWRFAICRRNTRGGGLGCAMKTYISSCGPQCDHPNCGPKFGRAAQRMAGCRASYRRVDRLEGTHDMDRFALTQDIDHSPAAKDHEDFAAPFLSADCRHSGGMCGALRYCAFRRQADLSARLQGKFARIHRN